MRAPHAPGLFIWVSRERVGRTNYYHNMPRFYFDIREDDHHHPDDDGNDLPDIVAAEREAVLAATEILRDKVSRHPVRQVSVEVRNESGQRVATSTVILQSARAE